MIKIKLIKQCEPKRNRRIYNIGEELIVHNITNITSWYDHYMYRYRKGKEIYLDKIAKDCAIILKEYGEDEELI